MVLRPGLFKATIELRARPKRRDKTRLWGRSCCVQCAACIKCQTIFLKYDKHGDAFDCDECGVRCFKSAAI